MASKSEHLQDCFALIRVLGRILTNREYRNFIKHASKSTIRRICVCLYNTWTVEAKNLPKELKVKLTRHKRRIERICDPQNNHKRRALSSSHQLLFDLETVFEWQRKA